MPTAWILADFSINEFIKLYKGIPMGKVQKACILFLAFIFTGLSTLSAQVKQDTSLSDVPVIPKVLLIPFEPKMLMSEIGKAVNTSTHLSYNDITKALRMQLDLALFAPFKQHYITISLLQNKKKADSTLTHIYNSIGYKYDLLPGADTTGENHDEFNPKLQKKHFTQNGELEVPIDYSKRFMNVNVANHHLLSNLGKKYNVNTFIFINQLDIKNVSNPGQELTDYNFRRQVNVHYSILTMQNHYIAKGILTTYFPYNENNPEEIGNKYFSIIGKNMFDVFTKSLTKLKPGANLPPKGRKLPVKAK